MTTIDQDALNRLAEKIDGLDLSESERSMLDTLLERASSYEPEVEGFGFSMDYSGPRSGAGLSSTAFKLGDGLGVIIKPPPPPESRLPSGDDPLDPTKW